METWTILLIIFGSLFLLALVFAAGFCFLIRPNKNRREMEKYKSVKYAHRGLHSEGVAENSMTAFEKAKEMGFGIELDVQLSSDGELVVFHDATLNRVCGIDGRVKDFTYAELSEMYLSGTKDTVPLFKDVLNLIGGRVPLLIEVKMEAGESGIAEKLLEVIDGYKGDFIVESFNPYALKVLRERRPDIMRGILSCVYMKQEKYKGKPLYWMLENLLTNFIGRPDFIAYEKIGFTNHNLRLIRHTFGTPLMAWTVKSQEEEAEAISHGFDTVIFEGYVPEQ